MFNEMKVMRDYRKCGNLKKCGKFRLFWVENMSRISFALTRSCVMSVRDFSSRLSDVLVSKSIFR
jgi:hypothetical protein